MASNTEEIVWNEENQAKWVGTRPGYHGDQVTGWDVTNNNTIILYTVPANKVLLVFNTWLNVAMTGAGYGDAFMYLFDGVPAIVYQICRIRVNGTDTEHGGNLARFVPLVALAGYSIRLQSLPVGCEAHGGFEGILVDA